MLHIVLIAVLLLLGSAFIIFLPIIVWESHLPYSIPQEAETSPEHEKEVSED